MSRISHDKRIKVSAHSVHGQEADPKIPRAIEIHTHVIYGCNQQAQFDVFFNGLSKGIQDEIATREYPDSLDKLLDLATRNYGQQDTNGAGT